ncbi:MAG: tetratricopeptide repeat protein [Elusimicrobia bacterium]|nr:tetratricopeptide repeat protein [Elusimicrobiota bacterium]
MTGPAIPAGGAHGAQRVPPYRSVWAALARWLERPSAWFGLLAVSAGVCALIYFGLMRSSARARPRADFPVRPQIEAAIAAAQVRLSADPQDVTALVELGMLHFENGPQSYPDAVNELEEARRLGSLDPRIFYCLGVMYQELGLYPFALEEYQKHLRNLPDDKEVRMLAAKLEYRQGDYESAVKEYERLRYHDPDDPLVIENLGLSLWSGKHTARALESFAALKALGGLPARRAQFYLGQMALEAGRYQEAFDLMQGSLSAGGGPDLGISEDRIYSALAMACQKLNRPAEARDAWERVLKSSPNDAKALAALRNLNRRFPERKAKRR